MEDQILWANFKRGDIQSYENIYKNNIDFLYNYGLSFTQNDNLVVDQIQDLFVYLWENKEKLGEASSIRAYLIKSLRNRFIDQYRKNSKHTVVDFANVTQKVDNVEDDIINFEIENTNSQKLEKALQQLTSKQREIIFMRYTKNLPYEEIGEALGINYQSVRNLVHRAIVVLRKEMLLLVFWLFL